MNEEPWRPSAPWTSVEEAEAACVKMEAERAVAEVIGSIVVDTDEAFDDVIQFVEVFAYGYEDAYWVWPRVAGEQWRAIRLPAFQAEDVRFPNYGRILRFTSGPWKTHPGVYLQPYPGGGELHQVLVVGPLCEGSLKVVLSQSDQFLVKSLRACHEQGRTHRYVSIDSRLLLPTVSPGESVSRPA